MADNRVSAKEVARFDLKAPPEGFVQNPHPWYDGFLAHAPVLAQPDGSVLLCRHADLDRIYRDTSLY